MISSGAGGPITTRSEAALADGRDPTIFHQRRLTHQRSAPPDLPGFLSASPGKGIVRALSRLRTT